ncbi:MAG: tetratricopeptide repeat protein [Acidobacteria bacterium]|nr:tetratricopeptide repeat protein [Acidobacteriota bacterium]
MRSPLLTLTLFLACGVAAAQHQHSPSAGNTTASLMPGLGTHHHAVTTKNAEAQKFFDQGLSYVYAFNHDEAVRSFRRALKLDPQLAMAHWGIALALGPNINLDVDPERERAAYDAAQKALQLAPKASARERAYIEALVKRYSIDPQADLKKLAVNYKNAMGALSRRYPADLDAATLYAESAMDLRPWQLWNKDGSPAEGTTEIVNTLESVLRRNPNHVGAIHYYVHAVEASPHPERALRYAPKLPRLMPAAGHIVHMPAHIYERTGNYAAAAKSNEDAATADRAYIKVSGVKGFYPLMYYSHNLHFLAVAYSMEGRFSEAMRAARQLEANISPHLSEMPMLEGFKTVEPLVLVRFRRWNDVLKMPEPPRELALTHAVWHWARGMAYASTGKLGEAGDEHKNFVAEVQTVPADAALGLNKASDVFKFAQHVLAARIANANGDRRAAVESLKAAVAIEDSLAYDEPPVWFIPTREALGATLLRDGKAAEAEAVFRADLQNNPHSGRSLFGLLKSIVAQGKKTGAVRVQRELESAWKHADAPLKLEDL